MERTPEHEAASMASKSRKGLRAQNPKTYTKRREMESKPLEFLGKVSCEEERLLVETLKTRIMNNQGKSQMRQFARTQLHQLSLISL